MNKKQAIINAIIEMNVNMLDVLLDENKAYMDVPKSLFLEKLSFKFKNLKDKGVNNFIKVSDGTCDRCFKGCKGYTFLTKNNDYLDLLIKEKDNEVEDLFLCSKLNNEEVINKKNQIYFSFKEDEKTNYNPSLELMSINNRIERAQKDFEQFDNTITDIEQFVIWVDRGKVLYNSLSIRAKFSYNFISDFSSIYVTAHFIENIITFYSLAKKALKELDSFEDTNEYEMINWLIKYEDNELKFPSGYEKLENWEQNSLIKFDSEIYNIIIDSTKYRESIEFSNVFCDKYFDYMDKYLPSKEVVIKYGSIDSKLSEYLAVSELYLDILKKHNIKINSNLKKPTYP